MHKILFRSRWFAIGWVVLTLVSVAGFVSEGGGLSKIGKPADASSAQPDAAASPASTGETEVLSVTSVESSEEAPAAAASDTFEESDDYVVIDDTAPIEEASDEELAIGQ